MFRPRIRIEDLAELLNKSPQEIRRLLVEKGVATVERSGVPAVDLETLMEAIDPRTRRSLNAAAERRSYDLAHCRWTIASFPTVAALWDKKRNQGVEPREVSVSSSRIYWWKCSAARDHVWQVKPQALLPRRADGSYYVLGCPFCSHHRTGILDSLAVLYPDAARDWHPTKNGKLKPTEVSPGSRKRVWWRCSEGHVWESKVSAHLSGTCPYCSGGLLTRTNSLAVTHPALASEWHPTKNGTLRPRDVTIRERREIWWQCSGPKPHSWKARPSTRVTSPSCPYCTNRRISNDNSLAAKNPRVASEWHPTKNRPLTPYDVVPGSARRVWWKCPKADDHVWRCCVYKRTREQSRCPCCGGYKLSKTNSLARLYPKIAKEWHPTRNGDRKPSQTLARSTEPAWWRCAKGHEWKAVVRKRTGTVVHRDCPKCL